MHVSREKNQVADCITKMSFVRNKTLQAFDNPPREIIEILNFDKLEGNCGQVNLV